MKVLIYLEFRAGEITADSLGVASHLVQRGFDVTGILFAPEGSDSTTAFGLGMQGVVAIAVPADDRFPVAGRIATIAKLVNEENFGTLLFATSAQSCDIAAALCGMFDAGLLHSLVSLEQQEGELLARRTTLAETVVVDAQWLSRMRIGLFRCAAFPAPAPGAGEVSISHAAYVNATAGVLAERCETHGGGGVALRDADIIVAAGRGIGAPEKLDLIRDLAAILGGAWGVSLPLVDMGWAPRNLQVGQTGSIVQPKLYIACGISGQIQHRIGVENSGTIVAINKDLEAPIMGFCDLAVVGDLNKIIPELIAQMEAE